MNEELFIKLVSQIKVGKQLPDAIYLHKDAFSGLPSALVQFIPAVAKAISLTEEDWNIVKLFKKEFRLSLLHYPDFYNDSYPALKQSLNVNLSKLSHKITSYTESDNPPILHRKETMILPDNQYYSHFVELTQEGLNAGLYENTRIIGFKRSWENVINKHGYELIDGRLFRSSAVIQPDEIGIDRHKTALVRHELSSPMKTLVKHGYLEGSYSIFDYGCGRGDDLRELEAHGLDALGWDPNFQPDNEKIQSDIINLGFVLNVIEDQDERLDALLNAWELTDKFLVVSVMLANDNYISQFKPFKDGVLTSRNTFQKYYAQSEIKAYLERSLHEDAITVAPGIFYIFKDKIEEQKYLQEKYKRHHKWQQLTSPQPLESKDKAKLLITQNSELFNEFWNTCLELGRIPANDEFEQSDRIKELIGSHKKTFSLLQEMYDTTEFEQAERSKKEDLLLYFTMGLFEKRKPYIQQPKSLKRDIKVFFHNYKTAQAQATKLVFKISDRLLIEELCQKAEKQLPASKLDHENGKPHSLTLHQKFLNLLPLVLRVYVNAALQMYGELDDIQLIKIHIHSGKVTLLGYEGFYDSPLPQLKERIKIKMAEQDVNFFDYAIEEKRPLLLNKIDYIDDTFDDYKKQKAFNKRLFKILKNFDDQSVNINKVQIIALLNTNKIEVIGYRFHEK